MQVTDSHVYFWKGPLSQWSKSPFTDGNVLYYSEDGGYVCKLKQNPFDIDVWAQVHGA